MKGKFVITEQTLQDLGLTLKPSVKRLYVQQGGVEKQIPIVPERQGGLITKDGAELAPTLPADNRKLLMCDSNITVGLNWSFPKLPHVELGTTTDVSIPDGIITTVSWETEVRDTDNFFTLTSPTRVTIRFTGIYFFIFTPTFATNTVGMRRALVSVNDSGDTVLNSVVPIPGGYTRIVSPAFRVLSQGDYLRFKVYQNSGGALLLTAAELFIVYLSAI